MPKKGLSARGRTTPRAQIETPLDKAVQLSAQVGNTVFLKREDMQQVISGNDISCDAVAELACCQGVRWLPLGGRSKVALLLDLIAMIDSERPGKLEGGLVRVILVAHQRNDLNGARKLDVAGTEASGMYGRATGVPAAAGALPCRCTPSSCAAHTTRWHS